MTDLVLETFRMHGAMIDAGNRITKPYGLTSARWQVMGAIDLNGGGMPVSQIARQMGLSRQAVQRVVNDLKRLEMVLLKKNPADKRAPLVSISKRGAQVMTKVNAAQIQWVNNLAQGISKRDLVGAYRVLEKIRKRSTSAEET